MKTSTGRFATRLLIAALAMPCAPAQAESFAPTIALAGDRERVAAMLARPEVQAQLQANGVDAAEAGARVAALSDEEAAQLAAHMNELPSGGNPAALAGIVVAAGYAIFAVAVLTVSVVALAGYGVVKLMQKAAS
jgi:hypothetical protein